MNVSAITTNSSHTGATERPQGSILAFAKGFADRDGDILVLGSSPIGGLVPSPPTRTDVLAPSLANTDIFSRIASLLGEQSTPVRAPHPRTEVVVTGRWEGAVSTVDEDTFDGEFVPVGRREPRLRATFLVSEVDADDMELVRPGALFYIIASEVRMSARRWQPSSVIQFRRIPRVTGDDVSDALAHAVKLRQKLGLA